MFDSDDELDRETILIPLLMASLIVGIYAGAYLILSNLAHAYGAGAATQSIFPSNLSMTAVFGASVGTILVGFMMGLIALPGRKVPRKGGV